MARTELQEPETEASSGNGRVKNGRAGMVAASGKRKKTKSEKKAAGSAKAGSAKAGSAPADPEAPVAEETSAETNAAGDGSSPDAEAKGSIPAEPGNGEPKDGEPKDGEAEDKPKRPRRRRRKKLDPKELAAYKSVVEGLLFSSREPVGASRLGSVIGDLTTADVKAVIELLSKDFKRHKRGVMIEEVGGGYRIVTIPDLAELVRKLHRIRTEERLSAAALETLAIIAYRQPIIRADIEVIRGVACGGTLKWLMEKGLIKILGRAEVLGRPLLYGSTQGFLEQFGINDIKDLPRVDEFRAKTQ